MFLCMLFKGYYSSVNKEHFLSIDNIIETKYIESLGGGVDLSLPPPTLRPILLSTPRFKRYPATTNVRQLGSVKNCPCKYIVIVGPYLTYHDHLV